MSRPAYLLPLLLALPGGPVHLPVATVAADLHRGRIVVELPPVDLPANPTHDAMALAPVASVQFPVSGSLYGFDVDIVDTAGRVLPEVLLHHFNLIDPDHRELFLPISRRMVAAGRETGAERIPWLLFGCPVQEGERVFANGMLFNPTDVDYRGVRIRLTLYYTPAGRPWPLFRAYPWQLDVAFPVGDKSFDLPPGPSERSYEASPAIPGTIVAIGGHIHDYGVSLELKDVTTGKIIWRTAPIADSTGHVLGVPIAKLFSWTRLGAHIVPAHRYRVTVVYDNLTGHPIPDGGMGVLGGLFVPDRGVAWPAADTTSELYREDLRHAMRLGGEMGPMRMEHVEH